MAVTSRDGKPMNVGDALTVIGCVTEVSGTGPAAIIEVQLAGSGILIAITAQDVAANTQNL